MCSRQQLTRFKADICIPAAQMAGILPLPHHCQLQLSLLRWLRQAPASAPTEDGVNQGMTDQMLLCKWPWGRAVTCPLVAEEGFFGFLAPLDLNSLARLLPSCKDITGTIFEMLRGDPKTTFLWQASSTEV